MSRRRKRMSPRLFFAGVGAVLALAGLVLLRQGLDASWLLAYLGGINIATFLLYGFDKLAATHDRSRVPEAVLHGFAFAGGTPLAWLSQQLLRHKTQKSAFRRTFILLAIVQVALIALAWYWTSR